jgi:hypothetical protein
MDQTVKMEELETNQQTSKSTNPSPADSNTIKSERRCRDVGLT